MLKRNVLLFLVLSFSTLLFAQKPRLVVPTGHSGSVHAVSCSADGKYVLTAGSDRLLKIWNESGQEIRTIRSGGREYRQVQLSPDGSMILAAYCQQSDTAWVLDAGSGITMFDLEGDKHPLSAVKFSPDGKSAATADEAGKIFLWKATSGSRIREWQAHQSAIVSLDFSPDGSQLATLANDGSATVWQLTDNKVIFNWRVAGNVIRYSPDGKTICIGAFNPDKGVSFWSAETGQAKGSTDGYNAIFSPDSRWVCVFRHNGGVILPLDNLEAPPLYKNLGAPLPPSDGPTLFSMLEGVFLPDGKRLLLNAGHYPVVLELSSNTPLVEFRGYAEPVQSVAFSPDDKHCLVGSRNALVIWDLEEGAQIKRVARHLDVVQKAIYLPDGSKFVSSADDYINWLSDAGSGDTVFSIPMGLGMYPVQSYAGVMALSPDGNTLVKGHSNGKDKDYPLLSFWNLKDGKKNGEIRDREGVISELYDLAYSPDGKRLAVVGSGGIKIWDIPTQNWIWQQKPDQLAVFRTAAFSRDGTLLASGDGKGTMQLWDAVTGNNIARILADSIVDNEEYEDKLGLGAQQGLFIKYAIAFSADGKWRAGTASNNAIQVYDAKSDKKTVLLSGHDGPVIGLDFTKDGSKLISASRDNTLRIWDLDKGLELARIFLLEGSNWVVTTPSGLFDASPGAMNMMYFLTYQEVIELEQIKGRYYEPGLLAKIMGWASGELRKVDQFEDLPLYPIVQANIEQNQLQITLKARRGGIGKLSLFVNGKEVEEDINPDRLSELSVDLKKYDEFYLANAPNTLTLRLFNQKGWLKSPALKLPYTYSGARGSAGNHPAASTTGDEKPRLFVIAIGTSDYGGSKLDLKYADEDAFAMASALTQAGRELFETDVNVQLYTTGVLSEDKRAGNQPVSSKTNILQGFENLAKEARPSDVVVLYFSGHGITYGEAENAQFYYLTKDIASENLSDPEMLRNFAISSDELTEWLTKKVHALKQVMILDACNSGKIVESFAANAQKDLNPTQVRAIDRMKDRTGMFILTGSAADMVSYEAGEFGQGLLTYSLLQGMSGMALTPDKRVDVMTLFQYSRDRVPEMARSIKGIQIPTLAFPLDGGSFDIGIVNKNVRIPLATVKPVFIRNNYQDETDFEDVLGLSDAIELYFRKQMAKGSKSNLIFVDVKEYDNAFSLKGRYTVEGEKVSVQTRLFKGKMKVGEAFKLTGNKDDVPGLAKQILDKATSIIKVLDLLGAHRFPPVNGRLNNP
ncbi:MAG: caspase family protein [Saprospiraceae bacterium]|nr:caspase family protein [Saprospiraceae bacterium]